MIIELFSVVFSPCLRLRCQESLLKNRTAHSVELQDRSRGRVLSLQDCPIAKSGSEAVIGFLKPSPAVLVGASHHQRCRMIRRRPRYQDRGKLHPHPSFRERRNSIRPILCPERLSSQRLCRRMDWRNGTTQTVSGGFPIRNVMVV